eukprot:10872108-Prorocentrum_lima.AAC.1
MFSFSFGTGAVAPPSQPPPRDQSPARQRAKRKTKMGPADGGSPAPSSAEKRLEPKKPGPGRPPRNLYQTCTELIQRFRDSERTDAKYW